MKLRYIYKELIESILSEGASDILYHFTHIDYVSKILKSNTISMTSTLGSASDTKINNNRFFYLSTTRSKSSGFNNGDAKLVLDGRKLKQNYKIVPVDYWGYPESSKSEQEDRIVSNKSEITNAINYISAIHLFYDKRSSDSNVRFLNNINEIIHICDKYQIPLYVYTSYQNWLNQIGSVDYLQFKKSLSTGSETGTVSDGIVSIDKPWYRLASLLSYMDKGNYNKIVDFLKDPNMIADFNEVFDEESRKYSNRIDAEEVDTRYKHDAKYLREKPDKATKFLLNLLVKDMQKRKVYDIKSYIASKRTEFSNISSKPSPTDIKKKLVQNLASAAYMDIENYINKNFNEFIEIDGKNYDHAYESEELTKIINDYYLKLRKAIESVVNDPYKDVFYFGVSGDDIKKYFDYTAVKVSDKLTVGGSFKYEGTGMDKYLEEMFYSAVSEVKSASKTEIAKVK